MNPYNRKIILAMTAGALIVGAVILSKNEDIQKVVQKPAPIIEQSRTEIVLPTTPIHTYADALASITLKELKDNLYYLASDKLEGRMSGKKGNIVAAAFIKEKYESFGLETMYHKFNISRLNPGPKNERGNNFTQNIYAWIEGNDPQLKNEIVVVGAHMDHIGYGPSMSRAPRRREIHNGADDNASGTVALIEIAEAFSLIRNKIKRTVVFQSYSAEEMGLIGARHYCNYPQFPRDKPSIRSHVAMINMDMIGYLKTGRHLTGFNSGNSSPNLGEIINDLNNKYSFAQRITSRGAGGSDHAPFYNNRIPVAFLHTGTHRYYHTPDDTANRINYEGLERVSKYAFELAYRVVQSEDAPRFNVANFKEMLYIHDHGEEPFPHDN